MSGVQAKGGKKNRKHGKNKKSPSMQRYVLEDRLSKNKARRARKQAKLLKEHAAKNRW